METIRNLFVGVFGFVVMAALVVAPIVIIFGGVALAAAALPYLAIAVGIQFVCTLLILPLAFFRSTRLLAGKAFRFFSYLLGFTTWLWGLLVTYTLWGWVAVFIGLFLFGVGVVPMAIVAYGIEGLWWPASQLVISIVLIAGSRLLGYWFIEKSEYGEASAPYSM